MAPWTHNSSQPRQIDESPGTKMFGQSEANRHLGNTFELEESFRSQVQEEEPTETLAESAQNATQIHTASVKKKSHIKQLGDWWSHNIRLNLEHGAPGGDPRDYLALERTFLGWFRTSVTLISLSVIITQLFVLKDVDPTKGKVLGVILSCGGIIVLLLGCVRYFEQQRLLAQGKALSGGWHHQVLIILLLMILMALFVIVIVDA